MSKELVISSNRHETRVALVEDEQVVEVYHQRENEYSLAGSIHKGRVTRVLPGMQSAFVDIGLDRDAFLYVSDFFEDNEEYDKIVTSVEEKILKLDKPGAAAPRSPCRSGRTGRRRQRREAVARRAEPRDRRRSRRRCSAGRSDRSTAERRRDDGRGDDGGRGTPRAASRARRSEGSRRTRRAAGIEVLLAGSERPEPRRERAGSRSGSRRQAPSCAATERR